MPRIPLTIVVIVIASLLLNACSTTGPAYTAGGMFQDIEGSGDLWNDVRRGMKLRIPNNSRVRGQIEYLRGRKSFLDSMQRNARPYLYEVVTELKKRRMPMELALLPAIESAYRTTAYSHSGAAGIWQFIRSTGDYYGLKRTRYIDMRRDPKASTQAALDYLEYLHKFFNGDWELAIAAYNGGEGTISRAQKANAARGLKTDFWSLGLRKETMDYVPRLFALAKMIDNPRRYGLTLYRIPKVRVLSTVTTRRAIDLKEAARRSDMDANAFAALNARYVRHVTVSGSSNRIIVPRHKYNSFRTVLASMPEARQGLFAHKASTSKKKRTKTITHKVRKGETLTGIARSYGVTVDSIRKANNIRGSNIRIGQRLKISGATKSRTASSKSSARTITYTVKSGDSVYAIARRYGTSVDRIRKDNGIQGNNIRIGQKLKIRTSKSTASSASSRTHRVSSGDTLYGIARKYGVTVGQIEEANGLKSTNLRPGQTLKIPAKR
ncbi:MAG: LysM peptidoglycan-binding domain-containing protein [Gammaproteobacteria bacterium]